MANVCIKDINDGDWLSFKSEAAKANKTMGEFFSAVFSRYKREPKNDLETILKRMPVLSKEEADEIMAVSREFRKETEFR